MDEEWVVIKKVQGLTEAHIIKGLLESHGIPVKLQYETASVLFGIRMDGIGEVRILIQSKFIVKAETIAALEIKSKRRAGVTCP